MVFAESSQKFSPLSNRPTPSTKSPTFQADALVKLAPCFYRRPTLELAPDLIGRFLVRAFDGELSVCRIVEVEAYHQLMDEASHSFRGATARNAVMFGPAGRLYVYFIYGMHCCMNLVTEGEGIGAAILIRALEPLSGIEQLQARRGPSFALHQLANGPGKCCQALGLSLADNGLDLQGQSLWLTAGEPVSSELIRSGTRIGISKSRDLPWRFCLGGNRAVSKPWPADFLA